MGGEDRRSAGLEEVEPRKVPDQQCVESGATQDCAISPSAAAVSCTRGRPSKKPVGHKSNTWSLIFT